MIDNYIDLSTTTTYQYLQWYYRIYHGVVSLIYHHRWDIIHVWCIWCDVCDVMYVMCPSAPIASLHTPCLLPTGDPPSISIYIYLSLSILYCCRWLRCVQHSRPLRPLSTPRRRQQQQQGYNIIIRPGSVHSEGPQGQSPVRTHGQRGEGHDGPRGDIHRAEAHPLHEERTAVATRPVSASASSSEWTSIFLIFLLRCRPTRRQSNPCWPVA